MLEIHETSALHVVIDRNHHAPASMFSVMQLASKMALALQLICVSADATFAQEEQQVMQDTQDNTTLIESEKESTSYDARVRRWASSEEGVSIQRQLETAIRKLNDSFSVRQEATEEIMRLMEKLTMITHPFPEGLRTVLGNGIIENGLYNDHARQDNFMNHGYTWPESARLAEIQDELRRKNFQTTPRIMPGEYSVHELCEALREQTGLTFSLNGNTQKESICIAAGSNTWIDAVSALQESVIERSFLHYDHDNASIDIDSKKDDSSAIFLEGPYIFTHHYAENSSTYIVTVPTVGRLVRTIESRSVPRHFLFLPLLKESNEFTSFCLADYECEHRDTIKVVADTRETQMRALAIGPKRRIAIPFQEDTVVGRYQRIRVNKHGSAENQFFVRVDIKNTEYLTIDNPPNGQDDDMFETIVSNNEFYFTDSEGNPIYSKRSKPKSSGWSSQYVEFLLDREPETIHVEYPGHARTVIIQPPADCLPKNTNP